MCAREFVCVCVCSLVLHVYARHTGLNNRCRPFNLSSLTFWLLFSMPCRIYSGLQRKSILYHQQRISTASVDTTYTHIHIDMDDGIVKWTDVDDFPSYLCAFIVVFGAVYMRELAACIPMQMASVTLSKIIVHQAASCLCLKRTSPSILRMNYL